MRIQRFSRRLGSIEAAGFEADDFVAQSAGGDVIGDMRRILPMVAEGSFGDLLRGGAVREGDGSERGVAYGGVVKVQHRVLAQAVRIVRAQRHDEVVRMLAVDNRHAVSGFAGLEELRVALGR